MEWSLPGGGIEETGLTAGPLRHLWSGPRPYEEGFAPAIRCLPSIEGV